MIQQTSQDEKQYCLNWHGETERETNREEKRRKNVNEYLHINAFSRIVIVQLRFDPCCNCKFITLSNMGVCTCSVSNEFHGVFPKYRRVSSLVPNRNLEHILCTIYTQMIPCWY